MPQTFLSHDGASSRVHDGVRDGVRDSARRAKTVLKGQWALVTGATSGIGRATAELLADEGVNLILTGRRDERLSELGRDLASKHAIEILPLAFDVRNRSEVEAAFGKNQKQVSKLSILINNAGLAAGADLAQNADLDDWENMVDTNLKGLLFVTRLCLPHLLKQPTSHIVNLGSVAGRWTYPGGSVYCATKFAVRAMTDALRLDLLGKPIRVTNIEPGMVETEFSMVRLKDEAKAKDVYRGVDALDAFDIAESIVWCLERPGRVNIQELMIFPRDQAGVGPSYTHRAK